MATVVNNPTAPAENNSSLGTVLAVVALLIVVFLFLYYGLPALGGRSSTPAAPEQAAPNVMEGGDAGNTLDVEVPEQIDVNVQ